MSFSINKLDVVFFQRNTSNSAYEQINISGSSALFYLDENGILQAENISKILKDGGTTKASLLGLNRDYIFGDIIYAVDTVTIGRPNSLAKYVAVPNQPLSFRIVDTDTNTNDTPKGISIGKAVYDKSVNATLDISGTVIITGSLIVTNGINFPSSSAASSISSSYSLNSLSSSYSLTASYISGSLKGTVESASYSLSSSYSRNSLSASYCESGSYFAYTYYNVTQSYTYTISASWASSSLSSSYSLTASYISGSIRGTVESASYSLSSSYSLTASYVSGSIIGTVISASYSLSSSYALNSTSASQALTASYISGSLDILGSPGYYPKFKENTLSYTSSIFEDNEGIHVSVPLYATSSWAISASWAPSVLTSSYALTASYISGSIRGTVESASYALSASWAPSSEIPSTVSSSWASSSLSSSYSLTASYISGSIKTNGISGYYPIYFNNSLSETSSIFQNTNGIYISVPLYATSSWAISASWAPSSVSPSSDSSSWASSSISSSYSLSSSYARNALSASWSPASEFPTSVSASWASSSLSSSYSLKAFDLDKSSYNISVLFASQSKWATSASWASSSVSSSYSTKAFDLDKTSYNISVLFASSSRFAISASYASSSLSASYAPFFQVYQTNTISASWASSSISSSYSLKSFDLDKSAYNISVLQSSQSKWATSASWASSSYSSSYSLSASYARNAFSSITSSYCVSGSYFDYIYYNVTQSYTFTISASWASSSLSSSYSLKAFDLDKNVYNISVLFASSSKFSTSSSYASRSLSASYAPFEPNASASIVIQLENKQNSLSGTDNYTPRWQDNNLTSTSSIFDTNTAVGIGTNNPLGKLDVHSGDTETATLNIRCSPSVAGQGGSLYHQSATYAFQQIAQTTADSINCHFTTNAVSRTNPNTKIREHILVLKGDGNIGIGTNAPVYRIHAYTSSNNSEWITIHNTNTGSAARTGFVVLNDQSSGLYMEKYSSTFPGDVRDCGMVYVNGYTASLILGTVGTERMRIAPSGYVGIGTTDPSIAKLTVDGNIATNGSVGFYNSSESSSRFTISKNTADYLILRSIVATSSYIAITPPNINIGEPMIRDSVISLRKGLDLNNTGSLEYIDFYNAVSGSNYNQYGLRLQKRGTGNYRDFVIDRWDGSTDIESLLVISASNKYVGIGTSNPQSKLHVYASTASVPYPLYVSTDAGYINIGIANTGYAHFLTDRPAYWFNSQVQTSGSIVPYGDNVFDLGSTIWYWRYGYIRNLVGNTVTANTLVGTASWANKSISSSYAPVSLVGTNNFIPRWQDNSLTSTSSILDYSDKSVTIMANKGSASVYAIDVIPTSSVNVHLARFGISGVTNGFVIQQPTAGDLIYTFVTGKVGIGTTNPSGLLDVYSGDTETSTLNVRCSPSVSGQGGSLYHQSSTYAFQTLAGATSDPDNCFFTTHLVNRTLPNTKINSNLFTLMGKGYVGINTSAPDSRVHALIDTNGTEWVKIQNTNSGSGARTGFVVLNDQASGLYLEKYSSTFPGDVRDCGMVYVNGVTSSLVFGTIGTERMRITPAGKVGIGTTNPSLATLQIQGNVWAYSYTGSFLGTSSYSIKSISASYAPWEPAASSSIVIQLGNKLNSLSGTNNYVPYWKNNTLSSTSSIVDYDGKSVNIMLNRGSGSLYALDLLPTSSANVHVVRMGINGITNGFIIQQGSPGILTHSFTSGRVGIITSNPQAELHVIGQISASSNIISHVKLQAKSAQPGVILWETDTTDVNRQIDVTSGVFRILKVNDAYDTFTSQIEIDSSGNVGINTSSPQSKLHIYGTSSLTPYPLLVQTNNGYINIGVANTGYAHVLSDRPAFYFDKSIHTSGSLLPYIHNSFDLGSTGKYWYNAYITNLNATNVTADTLVGTSSWANKVVTANPGTGTDNYIPKWSSNTLTGTSLIYDNGSGVGIGTTTLSGKFIVNIGGGSCNIVNNTLSSSHSNPTNWSYGGLNILDPTNDTFRWMHLAIGGTGRYASGASVGRIGFHQLNTNAALSESCGAMIAALTDNNTLTSKGMHMTFYTRNSSDGNVLPTEQMRITNAGNIGIGTAAPENSAGWSKVMGLYNSLMFRFIIDTTSVRSIFASHYSGYYSGLVGSYIGTETNNALHLIHNSAVRVILTGSYVGIGGTVSPSATLYVDIGSGGSSGNTVFNVNKQSTTYLNVRGDGRVGIGAAPSSNGFIQVTAPDTSTPHFSLTNGITNANASNAYTFRGWWCNYFASPGFNGGTSGQYYIQVYS